MNTSDALALRDLTSRHSKSCFGMPLLCRRHRVESFRNQTDPKMAYGG
ncbi:MAG TPA: hypothetical protein VHQ64_10130 [Pyrinomonadaceae bacterium]|nr:hypothetical protein [Pyrinomonadaceae bacterium]